MFDCYFKLKLKTVLLEYLNVILLNIFVDILSKCYLRGSPGVVRKMGEVLRMCSNLIVGVYSLIVLCIERRGYLENLGEKMMVIFDLLMALRGVITFLVGLIMLYWRKYLSVHLLSLVLLVIKVGLSNMVVVRCCWGGGLKGFSRICSDVGVEPR